MPIPHHRGLPQLTLGHAQPRDAHFKPREQTAPLSSGPSSSLCSPSPRLDLSTRHKYARSPTVAIDSDPELPFGATAGSVPSGTVLVTVFPARAS